MEEEKTVTIKEKTLGRIIGIGIIVLVGLSIIRGNTIAKENYRQGYSAGQYAIIENKREFLNTYMDTDDIIDYVLDTTDAEIYIDGERVTGG